MSKSQALSGMKVLDCSQIPDEDVIPLDWN